ncbi:MAG: DUF177 domain-containing protein [Crocinitomicaceae bacterium]|nr:DUF177 domain-containing protein [Crocinitomicaceae bacterium]
MANSKREFVIPFIGLKIGSHTFEYDISSSFFDSIEYSIIHEANVHVDLVLEKKETMMIGNFSCEGEVSTYCDRCNDPLNVPVKGSFQLIFKLSTQNSDDESLIILPPEAYELDVTPYIYELITVSLPFRKIHPEGECNEEMVEQLHQYLVNDEDEDEDWDDEDWDDEDWDEDDFDDDIDDDFDDNDTPDDDDIDPRWSILKNLN